MSTAHPLRLLGAVLSPAGDASTNLVRVFADRGPDLGRAPGWALGRDPDRNSDRDRIHCWRSVIWAAGQQLVSPSLAGALSRKGVFADLPVEVQDYLAGVQELNQLRNRDLLSALEGIAQALNPLDLKPLLLKGAIALLPGQYPGAADRVIGDLDLGVPAGREAIAAEALQALGYRSWVPDYPLLPQERRLQQQGHQHGKPLLHPELPVAVELHRRLLNHGDDDAWLQAGVTTATQVLSNGAVVLLPDPGTRLLHNFLHNQIQDRQRRRRGLDLRQLLEFAALAQAYPQVLTPALLTRLRPERRRAFLEYLAQAEYWLGLDYPPALPRTNSARWELWLQQRVATSRGWRWFFAGVDFAARLPPRLYRLPLRLVLTPGWLPCQLKGLRKRGAVG